MNMDENVFDIIGQHLSQGDVTVRPPHFHKQPETRVIYNLERSVAFCDLMDKRHTNVRIVRCISD